MIPFYVLVFDIDLQVSYVKGTRYMNFDTSCAEFSHISTEILETATSFRHIVKGKFQRYIFAFCFRS